jgi:hypothetical protein
MPTDTEVRISKLLNFALSTDKEGKAFAAIQKLKRILERNNLHICQLSDHCATIVRITTRSIKPKLDTGSNDVPWKSKVAFLYDTYTFEFNSPNEKDLLSPKEKDLINTLIRSDVIPSKDQFTWLNAIYDRVKPQYQSFGQYRYFGPHRFP